MAMAITENPQTHHQGAVLRPHLQLLARDAPHHAFALQTRWGTGRQQQGRRGGARSLHQGVAMCVKTRYFHQGKGCFTM